MTAIADRPDSAAVPAAASAAVRRRSVVQAAWAAPLVLAAVAAPAAAASAPPAPTLYVSFTGTGPSGYLFLELLDADGTPLQQQFVLEGKPRGTDSWVAAFRPSTRADGTFSSTIPSGLTEEYSALRVVAVVPGYPALISEEQALPFS